MSHEAYLDYLPIANLICSWNPSSVFMCVTTVHKGKPAAHWKLGFQGLKLLLCSWEKSIPEAKPIRANVSTICCACFPPCWPLENPLQRFPRALLSFSVCPSPTSHKLKIFFLSIYTRQYPKKHSIITSQTCQISSDKEQLVFIDLALPPHWEKPGQSEVVIFLTLQISCFPAGAIAILSVTHTSQVNSKTAAEILKKPPKHNTKPKPQLNAYNKEWKGRIILI